MKHKLMNFVKHMVDSREGEHSVDDTNEIGYKLSCSGTRVASTRHSRAATYVLQLMPMHFSWTEVRHWVFLSERHVDAFFGESKMHWHIS